MRHARVTRPASGRFTQYTRWVSLFDQSLFITTASNFENPFRQHTQATLVMSSGVVYLNMCWWEHGMHSPLLAAFNRKKPSHMTKRMQYWKIIVQRFSVLSNQTEFRCRSSKKHRNEFSQKYRKPGKPDNSNCVGSCWYVMVGPVLILSTATCLLLLIPVNFRMTVAENWWEGDISLHCSELHQRRGGDSMQLTAWRAVFAVNS